MAEATTLLVLVLGALMIQRAAELAVNHRNLAGLLARGGRLHRDDGYGLIVLVHGALFFLLPLEWILAPWAGLHAATPLLLLLYLAAEGLRYWASFTLGWRWTTRVVVLPGQAPVRAGPYAFLTHPIYVAVGTALFVLPAAFGAWATSALLGVVNLFALRRRIAREEAAWTGSLQRGERLPDVRP